MASSPPESKYVQGKDDEDDRVTLNVAQPEGIVLAFNKAYGTTLGCVIHIIQLVFSAVGIICIATSSSDLLYLPLSWHLRAYIFASVFALMINAAVLVLNISSLIDAFPLNWQLFELIIYGVLSLLHLSCSSMMASAASYYTNQKRHHISERTKHLVIGATVSGFICCILFALSAVIAIRNLRRPQQQFASHRLPSVRHQSQTSQTSDNQNLPASRT